MSEDSVYNDADIVWVKLGTSWWPGEVCGLQRQPEGFLQLAKRKPYCVVKFFQEDTFEYVKSSKHILPFNCSKKDEFIRKGHELFKAKKKFMEKFPSDVSTAERLTRSLTRSTLFFNSRPDSIVKAILGQSPAKSDHMRNGGRCNTVTKIMNLTPNRNTETRPVLTSPSTYKCSLCDFQSTRQNVMVLHRKSHSNTPATTKSTLVNSSTNTSPTVMDCQPARPVSRSVSVGPSPPPATPVGRKTPLPRKPISVQSNDTIITLDDESDCNSEENVLEKSSPPSSNIELPETETKKDTIIAVQDAPVHETEENVSVVGNNNDCKSVEIQKSLLADWMDEDKDDDEEEQTPSEIKSKTPKESIPGPSEKESNPAPTTLELRKGVDLTYMAETSSSSESGKPATRIRNIPKKDRRNIDFTEFKDDENIALPNKTSKEPEKVKENILPLVYLVDDSLNETVSKQNEVPLTVDKSLCEGDLLVKSLPAHSKYVIDESLKEQNSSLTQNDTSEEIYVQQEITPEFDQSNKAMSTETLASAQFPACGKETQAIVIESNKEPHISIVPSTDPPETASSVSDLPSSEALSAQAFNERMPDSLNSADVVSAEPNGSIASECSPRHLVTSSPTKSILEQTDLNPHTETVVVAEHTHEVYVDKDARENMDSAELLPEENVQMKVAEEQSELDRLSNEMETITATKDTDAISENEYTPNEEMYQEDEENTSLPGAVESHSEIDPLAKESSLNPSEDTTTFAATESHGSYVCEITSGDSQTKRESLDTRMEESVEEHDITTTGKTPSRSSPLIGIQIDESVDSGKYVLTKLNDCTSEATPQQADECSIERNVETPNYQQEEKHDKEENLVAGATLAVTPPENVVTSQVEVTESKTSKSSLSCFDFEEEEENDVLTSIAKFKQKYISSEKNSDSGRPKTPDAQKYERELQDKQLSADIESVLKSTEMLVPTNSSTSAEVRGLPIKERGKRIFKSRNRFKPESCPSVSTTTTSAIKQPESSFAPSKKEPEIKPSPKKPIEPEPQSLPKVNQEKNLVHVQESVVYKMNIDNDDKVTNSEEEIVGRVVFSPAEVYAPFPENNIIDYSENTDAQVSSSVMDVVSEQFSVSDGHLKEIATAETTYHFTTEDTSNDLENRSNNYENLESNGIEGHHTINGPYYELVEASQLEPMVQFVQAGAVIIDAGMVQQVNEQLHAILLEEGSEPIYEEEVSYEDVSDKVIDPAYESSIEYELITTEVSSIVERIASEENSNECDNEVLDRETEIRQTEPAADCNLAIFSSTDNAVVDSHSTVVGGESGLSEEVDQAQPDNAIIYEESNTCSTVGNVSKSSYNDKNTQNEDKLVRCQIERPETSSDENSTIISEAESEFGSPTSMLDEDRVLKRVRRGSETSTTNMECPKTLQNCRAQQNEVIANRRRLFRKDNSPLQQSLQSDTNESASNDIQSSSSNINDGGKENEDSTILKETDTDTSDEEDDEDEEEISSPPIESLQDEHVEELYTGAGGSPKEFSNKEKENTLVRAQDSCDAKNNVFNSTNQDQSLGHVCALIPSTEEAAINSNKVTDVLTDTTSFSVIEQKSDIAGEELSAAEALLSIPNQSGSNLAELTDLSTITAVSAKSPSDENQGTLIVGIAKEEPMDSADMPQKLSGNTPKEVKQRKGRSHMKVTPRKRIIDSGYSEKPAQEKGAKIPKLSNDALPSSSTTVLKTESPENQAAMSESKDAEPTEKTDAEKSEKSTPEKVQITVDISNPLSLQIANILGPMDSSDGAIKILAQKRKQTLEDDITSFVIKKPSPTTEAEAEAADRETIAQIQNLCPQVEITRKSSKDEQISNSSQTSMPIILNSQILRTGNNQPIITFTPKSKKADESFDISNMPIVYSSENGVNEKVHLVITPTSNPQIIKQFQNQQQLVLNQRPDSRSFTPSPISATIPRITTRRPSNLRTKLTPTRQQMQEQNTQKEQELQQKSSQEDNLQPHILQQHYNPQPHLNIHQQQQPTQLQQYKREPQFMPNQQVQVHSQHSPAQYQNQFQLHQQQKLQQQLKAEQNILIQQHQQQMIMQQQMQQAQQHQQRLHQQPQQQQQVMLHQQLLPVEKNNHFNKSDKQMGVDAHGNKYVIIKAPSNTVVMDNNPETIKAGLQNIQHTRPPQVTQQKNTTAQRKQRQPTNANKKQQSHQIAQPVSTMQTIPNIKTLNQAFTLTQLPPSSHPHMTPVAHHPAHTSANVSYTNEPQRYLKEQQPPQLFTPTHQTTPSLPVAPPPPPAKGRGGGKGQRAKQIATAAPVLPTLDSTPKNVKSNANGKRTTGSYAESPRQRTTRSTAAKKNNNNNLIASPNDRQSSLTSEFSPTTIYQSTAQMSASHCSVNTVNTVTTISSASANSLPMKGHSLSDKQGNAADVPMEKSKCYAVPALPVPGFPETFLLCEIIDNKYREIFPKLLYLSPDGSRLLKIPDELVADAHLRLRDDQREPNPDYIQVGSGALQIDKSIRVPVDGKMENNGKSNEVYMQKHDALSVQEQASALLCLQEHMAQEQLVQKQYVQEHLVHEQLVQDQDHEHGQFVQEHFVQDQFGQEQFVQGQYVEEQFVTEQFVQDQMAQGHLVQEQFMQHHQLKGDQDFLHVAHSMENDAAHDGIIQQLDSDTVVNEESVESAGTVFYNVRNLMNICENNAEMCEILLTQEQIQEFLNNSSTRNETSAMVFTDDGCEQQVMMSDENILHTDDTSQEGLINYTDQHFINSGDILQIQTPDGLRIISTAPGNSGIVIQSMPSEGKTCEANILDHHGHKPAPAHDGKHSDNKLKFESDTLDDCLKSIGVSNQTPPVPTSLELSHSEIVTKKRRPSPGTIIMNEIVHTGLCHHPDITSLPSMSSNENYGFFPSNTGAQNDKVNANGQSIVTDMDTYTVGSSGGNFDDPGR